MFAKLLQRGVFSTLRKRGSVLDLGCGQHYPEIFSFCHAIDAARYVGVDRVNEEDPRFNHGDIWRRYDEFVERQNPRIKLTEAEFRSAFIFCWGMDVHAYLMQAEAEFDCVLLMNILHFPKVKEQWFDVVEKAKRKLTRNGMLCLEVFDTSWRNDLSEQQQPFTNEEFQELSALLPGGSLLNGSVEGKKLFLYQKP